MCTARPAPPAPLTLPFTVGDVISNKTLYTAFKCGCEGGVRYSSTYHVLVVVSNYVDPRHTGGAWKDGVLYYTGSGKAGDQDLKKGGNRRLCEGMQGALPMYYFEVHAQGRYTYRGRLEGAGEPFQREEPGADGAGRTVWIFPLRLAGA